MIDKSYLQDLLDILKTHNVKHIKMHGLELLFHEEQKKATAVDADGGLAASSFDATDSIENIASAVKKQEESLPIDLRADSLLDQDKILNWSSPDQAQNEPELPLTGEQPL